MMKRSGITLTEVLVAIFVTGLSLISLMTLFPLGALNMAEAIKDDRTGHCAANASAFIRTWWRIQVEQGQSDPWSTQGYPVYVDPIGVQTTGKSTIAGTTIPRVPAPWATTSSDINRQFTLLDDIVFAKNGIPNTTPIQRQGLYSWAYMVRRLSYPPVPPATTPTYDSRVLEYEIVVYHGRSLNLNSSGALTGEKKFSATITLGGNTVTLTNASKAAVKKGGWILDGTNGYFYRVRNTTLSGTSLVVEIENTFRATGSVVVCMQNVQEVFHKSTLE